jgi:hypothetical protein
MPLAREPTLAPVFSTLPPEATFNVPEPPAPAPRTSEDHLIHREFAPVTVRVPITPGLASPTWKVPPP